MKKTLLILLLIAGGCLAAQRVYSQQYSLIGASICTDGTQSTNISLSDSDPAKFYALYRDGKLYEIKSCNSNTTPNIIDFGAHSEPGKYTAVEFSRSNLDFEKPETGRAISGSVSINRLPVLYVQKKLEVRSGRPVNYQPNANIEGCTFSWTTRLDAGKATGFSKSGEGMINDTIVLQGNEPACVIYIITPQSPGHLGSCMGNSQEQAVWIKR